MDVGAAAKARSERITRAVGALVADDIDSRGARSGPSDRLANFIADSKSNKEFVLDLTSGELVEISS